MEILQEHLNYKYRFFLIDLNSLCTFPIKISSLLCVLTAHHKTFLENLFFKVLLISFFLLSPKYFKLPANLIFLTPRIFKNLRNVQKPHQNMPKVYQKTHPKSREKIRKG